MFKVSEAQVVGVAVTNTSRRVWVSLGGRPSSMVSIFKSLSHDTCNFPFLMNTIGLRVQPMNIIV